MDFLVLVIGLIVLMSLCAIEFYGQRCPNCGQRHWVVDYSKDYGTWHEDLHMHCLCCDERWSY